MNPRALRQAQRPRMTKVKRSRQNTSGSDEIGMHSSRVAQRVIPEAGAHWAEAVRDPFRNSATFRNGSRPSLLSARMTRWKQFDLNSSRPGGSLLRFVILGLDPRSHAGTRSDGRKPGHGVTARSAGAEDRYP